MTGGPPEPRSDLQDLFSRVGISLPRFDVGPSPAEPRITHYRIGGMCWTVLANEPAVPDVEGHRGEPEPDGQLSLALPEVERRYRWMIPPNNIAFMNASIRSVFRSTRLMQRAGVYLMGRNVLYLGDLTPLAPAQLRSELGQYRRLLPVIEEELKQLGLGLNAAAPWWQRPRDYYCRNY